jgi:hypothetical protein
MGSEGALLLVMPLPKSIFYCRASPLLAITLVCQHPTTDFMYPRPWFQDNGNGIFALTAATIGENRLPAPMMGKPPLFCGYPSTRVHSMHFICRCSRWHWLKRLSLLLALQV